MINTCVKLLNPIEEKKEQTLFKVAALADKRNVPILLCGAMARDILFWHMHGLELRRATMDVDISIQIRNWEAYEEFSEALMKDGFENPFNDHPEKLRDKDTGVELDLLPFGEIAGDGRMIVWPQDGSLWNIIGLQDAFEHALHLAVSCDGQTQSISFISAPALVMLKIVAVHDRPEDRFKKDGTDIGFVIKHYLDIGNRNRLKAPPEDDIMARVGDDLDLATAMLLGRDINKIAGEDTLKYVLELLEIEIIANL